MIEMSFDIPPEGEAAFFWLSHVDRTGFWEAEAGDLVAHHDGKA
jgi:hypothetical protein